MRWHILLTFNCLDILEGIYIRLIEADDQEVTNTMDALEMHIQSREGGICHVSYHKEWNSTFDRFLWVVQAVYSALEI